MPFRNAITSGLIAARFGGLPPPSVSSISGTINVDTTTTITVNGSRFLSLATVSVSGAATGGVPRAMVTTYVNSTQLTFSTNATSVPFSASQSFDIIVANGPGATATLSAAGTVDPDPTWSTAAGLVGTTATMSAASYNHQATDPTGVTVSLVSGAIPAGMSLASNGTVSGTINWATLSGAWQQDFAYTLRATATDGLGSADRAFSIRATNSYYYRQVYAFGYVVGGYSASTPWFAAHRVTVSNDAYASLGDRLNNRAGYVGGAWNDTGLWVYGTGGDLGAFSAYSGFNMFSESGFNNGDMGRTKDDTGVMSNHGAYTGVVANYIIGGSEGTNVRHNMSNNTIAYTTVGGLSSANYGNAWESDSYGYDAFGAHRIRFSDETVTSMPSGRPPGSDQAHSKSMSTKLDFAFVENGGNGSYTYTRHNFAAETLQNNWTNKPNTCGETNFTEGQDWGYAMGCCGSTCQNNWFWKQNFTNTASVWLGGSDRAMSSGDSGSRRA